MKILVVKRDKIGDMLLTTPLLAHLRDMLPNARIDVLANDYNAWVVHGNTAIDQVWVYPRSRHAGRLRWPAIFEQLRQQAALRRVGYDVAIAANGEPSLRAINRALATRAARTIAYVSTPSGFGSRLTDALMPEERDHEIERLLALCRPLRLALPVAAPIPRFTVPEGLSIRAREWLDASRFTAGRYVVIGVGARYAETQPQTAQVLRWADWAKRVLNFDTAIHYTPGRSTNPEYPGSEEHASQLNNFGRSYIRLMPPDIRSSVAIVALAGSSILPDGGLMHFAAISHGGVVGLFAEALTRSSPQRWGPRGHRVAVVNAKRKISDLDDAEVLEPLRRLHERRSAPEILSR
jgi:heptosyltransferase III